MMLERIDRRVLGALRLVSAASGVVVDTPMRVEGDGLRVVRNRSGLYVVASATGMEAATTVFDAQPDAPPVGSVSVSLTVADPSGRYLPRRLVTALPRQPDPAGAGGLGSLFTPVDVMLFPAPSAATGANWSVVRASVTAAGGAAGTGLGGALIRVVRAADSVLLARALADARGEALVAVQGLPAMTWGGDEGPVVTTTTDAFLDVIFDPTAAWPVDPDDLDARRGGLPNSRQPVQLAAGGMLTKTLTVSLP